MQGQSNQNTLSIDNGLTEDISQMNDSTGIVLSPLNDIYYSTISRIMSTLMTEEEDLINQIQVTGTMWGGLYNRLRVCRNKKISLLQDHEEIISLNTSLYQDDDLAKHNTKLDYILKELDKYDGYERGFTFLIDFLTLKNINNKRQGLSIGFQGDHFDLANENGRNIKNQIVVGSYNHDTLIDVEFIEKKIIKLSIKDGETDIFSMKGGYGMIDKNDLRRLLAIANIINFVISEIDINPDDSLGNAGFKVRKNILGKYNLTCGGGLKATVLTQDGLENIMNGTAKESLVLSSVFKTQALVNMIFRGGEDLGILLGEESQSCLGGMPINSFLLMNKLANYFNRQFPLR